MPYKPGDTLLDKYRIEALIGRGAFADVYQATHLALNAPRALKILRKDAPGLGSTEYIDFQARFELEAQLGARLDHPNIIRVYDFEKDGETLILVMEYAQGGSLSERLAKLRDQEQLLPIDEAVQIVLDVAQGLSAIHALDAVHRDIKPSNILFDKKGRAKVSDVGLAQIPSGPSMRSQLSSGVPHPGTPGYMSPEQESISNYLTPASDVYALGLVLFEMLTGRVFRSQRPDTRAAELRQHIPTWLDELLARMLSVEPEKRLWNGDEVAKQLSEGHRQDEMRRNEELAQRQVEENATLEEQERASQAAEEQAHLEAQARQQQATSARKAPLQPESQARVGMRTETASFWQRLPTWAGVVGVGVLILGIGIGVVLLVIELTGDVVEAPIAAIEETITPTPKLSSSQTPILPRPTEISATTNTPTIIPSSTLPPTQTNTPTQTLTTTIPLTPIGGGSGRIAFVSNRDGNRELYIMEVRPWEGDIDSVVNITQHEADDYSPNWSSDGEKIVFVSERTGKEMIHVLDIDSLDPILMRDSLNYKPNKPVFSPDNSMIAFGGIYSDEVKANWDTCERDVFSWYICVDGEETRWISGDPYDEDYYFYYFRGIIVIFNLEDNSFLRLWETDKQIDDEIFRGDPSWSPDDLKIAFEYYQDIFVIDLTSQQQRNLTNSNYISEFSPIWGPNGDRLTYVSNAKGNNDIYIMNIDGIFSKTWGGVDHAPLPSG